MALYKKFKRKLSYEKALNILTKDIKHYDKYFEIDPLRYLANSFDDTYDNITKNNCFKVRVPVRDINQLLELSKKIPIFCSNVTFSPAPLWPSCGFLDNPLINEFSREARSLWLTNINIGIYQLSAWFIAVKPLIDKGFINYLPQVGYGLHRWDYKAFKLPKFTDPYAEHIERYEERDVIESAIGALMLDQLMSNKLGCLHILPNSFDKKIINTDYYIGEDNKSKIAYALLQLKIPYIDNVTYEDLALIKEEEHHSFLEFENSILKAIDEIPDNIEDPDRLNKYINNIQRDIIDIPLRKLEKKLERITKYEKLRLAGYSLSSLGMIISCILGDGLFQLASTALGTINLMKVFDVYLKYHEKKSEVLENSIFKLLINNIHGSHSQY